MTLGQLNVMWDSSQILTQKNNVSWRTDGILINSDTLVNNIISLLIP